MTIGVGVQYIRVSGGIDTDLGPNGQWMITLTFGAGSAQAFAQSLVGDQIVLALTPAQATQLQSDCAGAMPPPAPPRPEPNFENPPWMSPASDEYE